MEQIAALLLLVVPGFICQVIYERLNKGRRLEDSFEKTVVALIYSVAILAVNAAVLYWVFRVSTVKGIKLRFESVLFLLEYVAITAGSSLLVALIWNFVSPWTVKPINWLRRRTGKEQIGHSETVWDEAFQDGRNHAVLIEKDGKVLGKGFVKYMTYSHNKVREVYLDQEKVIDGRPELFGQFAGTYIDFTNGLTIREYDLSKAYSELQKRV